LEADHPGNGVLIARLSTLPLPVTRPSSVAFGGAALDRLFVTTARQGLSAATLAAEPLAGALLWVDPGARGVAEPRFGAVPGPEGSV
jgi:sugar lactone lactonase YvrE